MRRIFVLALVLALLPSAAMAQNINTVWDVTIPEVPGGIQSNTTINELGTLHFIVQRFGPVDGYVGMTGNGGLTFDDYEIQLGTQGNNELWVQHGNEKRYLGGIFDLGRSYCVWMQVNATAGQYRVYWKPIATPGEPARLVDWLEGENWAFRNGPKPLTDVLAKVGYYHGGMMKVSRVVVAEGWFTDSPTSGCVNSGSPPIPVDPTPTPVFNSGSPSQPTPTPYPVQPTYTPFPTQEPLPTYTPLATLEPLPTFTAEPTHTAFPAQPVAATFTPLPTYEPLPTYTPYPTNTPYPARPTATPLPVNALPVCEVPTAVPDIDPIAPPIAPLTATPIPATPEPTPTLEPTATAATAGQARDTIEVSKPDLGQSLYLPLTR